MRPYNSSKWLALTIAAAMAGPFSTVQSLHAQSNGIVVESVNNFGGSGDLPNSIANGDGFIQGMVFPGSAFYLSQRWVDGAVYDTDFIDSDNASVGHDNIFFDRPGIAISFLTAHGITTDGCHPSESCSSTSQCQTPNTSAGERFPASCRFSPMDLPRCCYMVDRQALVNGLQDQLGGLINYTSGAVRWGESPQAGGWAGAGTNGGTNVVVLDISHGILPTFWYPTLRNANAGVQLILTLMTAGGDTDNVPQRGSTFASFFRAGQNMSVAEAWKATMASLPADLGQPCPDPGGGGFHGFNGCGCHIAVGMDMTLDRALGSMNEGWMNITNDNNDALGNQFFAARWLCNYTLPASDQSAWEKP